MGNPKKLGEPAKIECHECWTAKQLKKQSNQPTTIWRKYHRMTYLHFGGQYRNFSSINEEDRRSSRWCPNSTQYSPRRQTKSSILEQETWPPQPLLLQKLSNILKGARAGMKGAAMMNFFMACSLVKRISYLVSSQKPHCQFFRNLSRGTFPTLHMHMPLLAMLLNLRMELHCLTILRRKAFHHWGNSFHKVLTGKL